MSFYKKEYVDARRKRNTIIAMAAAALIIIILISHQLLKKSPEPDTTVTPPKPGTVEPLKRKEEPTKPKKKKDLPTIISETKPSVVLIRTFSRNGKQIATGSGFFITDTGDIISNRHVFQGAYRAEAETTKGKFPITKVLDQDPANDLVRLSLGRTGRKFQPLTMSESMPKVGESIMVIGNPLGLESTVSNGIVSAKRKFPPFDVVIQITCPISPGSSGSPVMNMMGEVIGVATFQMVQGQNLNFAIPISIAKALNAGKGVTLTDANIVSTDLIESMENPFDQGQILFSRDQFEGAIPYFKKAVEKDPFHAEAYYYLGICYRETGATDAVDAFKKAIEINPNYVKAYYDLGITYNRLNMKAEAIEVFKQVLEISPDHEDALLNLGIAYCLDKNFRSATSVLKRSVDIFPNKKAYYYLGVSYAGQTLHDKAIYAFKQAIEIDTNYVEAYIGLGASYGAVENLLQGIKALNQAVILDPQNPYVHYLLGMLHLANHDLISAENEYKLLIQYKGDNKLQNELNSAISKYKSYYGIR
ncbi:MAG: tetratricopeptide repeat protein [Candidatus Aminicenantes bacterium]|jgi:tetratricopeptide (TPR) repeat protein